jgi:hypothetical protein
VIPFPSAAHDAFAVVQFTAVGITFKQLFMPSTPLPSTHAVHVVSLHARTPYAPTHPEAHEVQFTSDVLRASEYGVVDGHATHSPVAASP